MEIKCTSCGARIPADDVNLERMVAKCRGCNSVFDFSEQIASAGAASVQRRRPFVGLPERMTVIVDQREIADAEGYRDAGGDRRGDLVIRRRWFEPQKHLFMLVFCLFWDGFLAFWYRSVVGFAEPAGFGILFTVFPLIHVAIGVGLTYATIASIFNTTLVGVRGGDFFVHHGPIPWRGNRTLPAQSIRQLFCVEKVTSGKRGDTRTYQLAAILDGGERVPLVSGLPAVEQALFLEQALEERLGIVDVAVAGEIGV